MSPIQLKVIIAGIRIKLSRGENLEDVLNSYVKLSSDDILEIEKYFNVTKN